MVARSGNFKQVPLKIVGSSRFGRYPKISTEKTYNMFMSDNFMVPYGGYKIVIGSEKFLNSKEGRGIFTSEKFKRIVIVQGSNVFLVNIVYSQKFETVTYSQVVLIGKLQTENGIVYIAENNKPQIGISDGTAFYLYDPTLTPNFQTIPLNFVPGYLTFHDTYFILSASNDNTFSPPANNTWRLSGQNDGTTWPSDSSSVGLLESKPDNTQAVLRFPSKGNMIYVMGNIVTEPWFDVGAQLFPYQRINQFNIDYGCMSPATVAYTDTLVVWLAKNELSGPIIMYSDGGMPHKITTDGIDYFLSTLDNPQDSQAFIYRQDGHLFYHINFYSDNFSLFYDFIEDENGNVSDGKKFYHACDNDGNYFIASKLCFFNNQYYFVTRNNGNLFIFDTSIPFYQDVDSLGNVITHEIPRSRICQNIREPDQDYSIYNDVGFTIESGETDYQQQPLGNLYMTDQEGNLLTDQAGNLFIYQQQANTNQSYLSLPRVDLSISTDGGASFGNNWAYHLRPIGQRKNKLIWWNLGIANDLVCRFDFWGLGRFVCTDGICNIRR